MDGGGYGLSIMINTGYFIYIFDHHMATPELFKTYASSLKKIAELPRYRHPADLVNSFTRPIFHQKQEINGELSFGQQKYPSQAQENLISELIKTRTKYFSSSALQRTEIASTEYSLWGNYLEDRVAKIPNDMLIQGEKRQKVYESFLIAKERSHEQMQLGRTNKLFYQISMGYKFDIAIHPLVMLRMVYPHYGYLINFKEHRLTFEQYIKFLEEMIAVSQLYYEGSTLHGSELLSFVFWKCFENKPTLTPEQFSKFLGYFKFNVKSQNLGKDFGYHLRNREGEIKEATPIRFDFWRHLYLERGL